MAVLPENDVANRRPPLPFSLATPGGAIAAVCSKCRSRCNLRIRHGQDLRPLTLRATRREPDHGLTMEGLPSQAALLFSASTVARASGPELRNERGGDGITSPTQGETACPAPIRKRTNPRSCLRFPTWSRESARSRFHRIRTHPRNRHPNGLRAHRDLSGALVRNGRPDVTARGRWTPSCGSGRRRSGHPRDAARVMPAVVWSLGTADEPERDEIHQRHR